MQEIRTELVEANGLTFEVDMCGDGDQLAMLLHGFPEHAFSWRYQMPLLADLGYTVWAPNQRGYARSSKPQGVQAYRMEHLVADIGALMDASGLPPSLLMGHDWGGAVAWTFAIEGTRPLDRLIVCNLPHPARFAETLRSTWKQRRMSWYMAFFQIPWLPEFLLGLNDAKPVGNVIRGSAVDKSMFPDDVLEVFSRAASENKALRTMINWYRAAFRGGVPAPDPAAIPVLGTPTLMIWGNEDTALSKEATFGTDRYVSDLTRRYLPGVSHWVQQEAPEAVNAIIAAWLGGTEIPAVGPDGRTISLD